MTAQEILGTIVVFDCFDLVTESHDRDVEQLCESVRKKCSSASRSRRGTSGSNLWKVESSTRAHEAHASSAAKQHTGAVRSKADGTLSKLCQRTHKWFESLEG